EAPLIAGIAFPSEGKSSIGESLRPIHQYLVEQLCNESRTHGDEIVIPEQELRRMANSASVTMADRIGLMFTLESTSTEALDAGDYIAIIRAVDTHSDVRLFGRFCHLDDDLAEAVRQSAAQEQQCDPMRIYAEIVHLARGREGN